MTSKKCWLSVCLIAVLLAVVIVTLVLVLPNNTSPTRYSVAAVASNGYECASIAREILEKGGSAADATIAAMFCEGISCAQCMGLGGGFLATIYDAQTGQVRVLNARERAPAATTETMFNNASSTIGGLAVAVPGELRGYGELHREYGRLAWSELVRPSADLCRRGHRVTEYMGRVLGTYADRIKAEPSMSEVYVNPATGEVYQENDIIVLTKLAETLDLIAEEGPEAMHNGSLTVQFVEDIRNFGGIITEDDLRNFRVEWQDAIEVRVSERHTLYTVPLPGSGSVLAFILNMVRGWADNVASTTAGLNLYWHRIIEAFKYGYAKRTGLGDPNRIDLQDSILELQSNLANPAWAQEFRSLVDDTRTFSEWQHYGADFQNVEDHGTAHASVIAPDGSAVSATSTINTIWGSLRRSQSTGIILNNEMDDFAIPNQTSDYDLPPSQANMLAPGLQPLSSMVPAIVVNDEGAVDLAIGAAGGTRITTQIALATIKVIQEGRDFPEVIAEPRIHHQLLPMEVQHEAQFDSTVLNSLKARGHSIQQMADTGFAAVVGIARDSSGLLVPLTDPRRVGSVDGM